MAILKGMNRYSLGTSTFANLSAWQPRRKLLFLVTFYICMFVFLNDSSLPLLTQKLLE